MATPEELLRKLEERFIVGEISAEQYQPLHDRLAAQVKAAREAADATADSAESTPAGDDPAAPAPATGSAGGMTIADSVIKGNVTSGAASVGNITINLAKDQAGGSNAELEYERYVLVALRSGGQLNSIRKDLEERRQALGVTMRLAREIEQACQMSVGGLYKADPPAPSQPAGPTPLSKFFKAASQSISTMFAAPPVPQTAAAAPKQPPVVAPAPRAGPPPMPPAAPKTAATPPATPPPTPPPTPAPSGPPPLGATPPPMPSPLAAGVKSELLTELNADVQKPVEPDAPGGQADQQADGKGASPPDRRTRPKSTSVPPPMPPPLPRR